MENTFEKIFESCIDDLTKLKEILNIKESLNWVN